ncbi:MAG: hypothetical protein QXO24_03250 [Candidatus Micrarchaeaceae archaeon]
MDEVALSKKLVIGLFALELIGFVFASLLNYGQNNPTLNQLQAAENSLQNQANSLAGAMNYTLIKNLNAPTGSFLVYAFSYIAYYFGLFINFVAKLINFILQIIVLVIIGFSMVLDILFVIIPSLFTSINLGVFNFIFVGGYALLWIVIGIYAFNIITKIIGRII